MNRCKKIISKYLDSIKRVEIIGIRLHPHYTGENEDFSYHPKFQDILQIPREDVLDLGCGAYSFPFAKILVDS
jgi:hypothetical protein